MASSGNVIWRTSFTIVSFSLFFLGAFCLCFFYFPLIHLISRSRGSAQRVCRKGVYHSFRAFIWMMHVTGVLDYHISGREHLRGGQLIIGNHPSLIDVIFVVSQIPDAYCVVKDDLWTNPLTHLLARFTGYVAAAEPEELIKQCVAVIRTGAALVMFPEGTRTVPDESLSFKRGAAMVMLRSSTDIVPVILNIWPPTLAKGAPWFKVPSEKVQYSMEILTPVPSSDFLTDGCSERQNTRLCTLKLQEFFAERLRREDNDGKPAGGYQSADSKYPGA
jgi:1-acyl-sn-glycerol-3-phosphate acyltransferase